MTQHEAKPKLVVHIGAGKTGSSSIQETLGANEDVLEAAGIKYLGLMLEHANQKHDVDWQYKGGSPRFFKLDPAQAVQECYTALRAELESLANTAIHTAVWSNEWIWGRGAHILPALEKLKGDGYPVEIICYVRRHDKWIQSAYAQWGIKHKSYPGPIRPFSEWRKGRNFEFYPTLKTWQDAFQDAFALFNYDAVGDVVAHFNGTIGAPPMDNSDDNITPSAEVLAAWAVFNGRYTNEVGADRFESFLRRTGLLDRDALAVPELVELLPQRRDFAELRREFSEDRARVNVILAHQGQPGLAADEVTVSDSQIDAWKMNQLLLRLLFSMQSQISSLHARVKRLEETQYGPSRDSH